MYYNIDIKSQLKHIMKNKDIFYRSLPISSEHLADVYDGEIYTSILNSKDGELIKAGDAYTFSLNTDGISICEKSNLDIWPINLVINEIKPEFRYCVENVIVAGMFF